MKLFVFTFLLIGVCGVAPQVQLPAQVGVLLAMRDLYTSLENLTNAVYTLVKSVNTNCQCGSSPSHGGLYIVANSLDVVSNDIQRLTTDLNRVIDQSGNVNGNLNPVTNDITKLSSDLDILAQNVRRVAISRDYHSGDFLGVTDGLEDIGRALSDLADVIDRIDGLSEVVFNAEIRLTQVDKGISDLSDSLTALENSINLALKKCGQTGAAIGNIPEGLDDANDGLEDIEDALRN